MKKMIINNAFFRLLIPPVYGILVYLMILLINNDIRQLSSIFSSQEVYVCIGLSYLVTEVLRLNAILLNKFDTTYLGNKILIQLLIGVLVTNITVSVSISAYFEYIVQFGITDTQLIIFNAIFGVSSLLYNLLFFSHLYLQKQNISQLNEERLLTDMVENELRNFKHEVNPTLLYDSLETLISLVHRDADESEEYIDHLSSVYRYILSNKKTEFTTLASELKAANHIVHLLNYKFDNKITLKSNLPDTILDAPAVPGSFSILVERAIRMTIINKYNPLQISIEYEKADGYIVIEYALNERLSPMDEDILDKIQNSYGYYSEKPVVHVRAYDQNYVKIPMLAVMEEPLTSEEVSVIF
ncbi:histidine kinase [Fulvivirga lutimaris]|uniref:histidine kinase n=1 Tax=Fulvivirga lutimaris TaxID=1819566 RepID=UPI0012BC58D8|nr:histidine kinase [Fulvivirga lutimaris]MTI41018.1 hypothetical protein [Fulvivirga lutimaris]